MAVAATNRLIEHLRRTVGPVNEPGDGQLLDSYLSRRDGMAFAALMRRHGPMVWGVCRRVAGHEQDAEDAFQATFLILVRRADSVWPRDHVGNWLHGVAFRTARKARLLADRRRAREKQLVAVPHPLIEPVDGNGDLRSVLDRELARMPEKYRLPLVFCDLESRSQREVARQLGLPVGTLCHRLQSARALLAKRLIRRGVALTAGVLAAESVPPSLAGVTLRTASQLSAGRDLASLAPPQIVALSKGAVSAMIHSKSRLIVVLFLLALLGGLGFGTTWSPSLFAGDNPPAARAADPPRRPAREDQIDDATFLRRISLDLRGTLPSLLETKYFLADKDPKKRRKVVEWMLEKVDADKVIDRIRYFYRLEGKDVKPDDNQRADLFLELMLKADDKKREDVIIELLWSDYKDDLRLFWDGLTQQNEKVKPDQDGLKYWSLQKQKLNLNDLTDDDMRKKLSDPDTRSVIEAWLQGDPDKPGADRQQMDATVARVFQFLRQQRQQPDDRLTREWVRVLLAWGQDDRKVDDATFLRRLVLDLTGELPTPLEQRYFQTDSDPKKRQKVIDWLLQHPQHLKRITVLWKEVVDAASARSLATTTVQGFADPLGALLDRLLADNRNNDQILDALTLAALARYPTETERSFALAAVAKSQNRKLDWLVVLKTLTSTNEFRRHAEALHQRVAK
jgi:RNA polymerase sigma factor (sigma-70 family)